MKSIKLSSYFSALVLTSLLFTACGSSSKEAKTATFTTVQVSVAEVTSSNQSGIISASGKVAASNSANLSTRMMGFVDKIHVAVGDKVRKGQLLISINNADLKAKAAQADAQIAQAKAGYENARKDYERFTNLFKENSASQKELDDMTSRFEMAKAGLEAAQQMKNEVNAQFSYANIRAPFQGVVTNKFVEEGNMANPGMTLMGIEAPGSFEVTAMVPESEISNIEANTDVEVLIKSIGSTLKGKVTEVSTSAKNTGGQYLVKVSLVPTEAKLLAGMFATVQFPKKGKTTHTTVMIPQEAIVTQGQLSGVYTVSQSNTAILRWLRLGKTYGNQVEVLSGLQADEAYIIEAKGKLFNGAPIQVK